MECSGSKFNTFVNGGLTTEIFLDLFKNHFLVHVTYRPLILLYDGHATHITMDIIETARNSDVHLFVLSPHSSHMLQQLDVSVFSPFKKSVNSELHKQMHETREQLPGFINTAYNSSMTVSNIMFGFCKTGIFPCNPEVVLQKPKPADPVPTAKPLSIIPTRKEIKDMRLIKVLFENKVSNVEETLKPNTNKK
ncbi:Hypothetical predicted protein [Mytilus galloprovincialis]|uniref:DDE-1 domain-containing protein n=1 Tax=Mytilus galloprovincialis TaxID=29158 RepID=A0A8B6ELF5_MYTGA|nr:Hypothetical predicted protein [Mytilus galloprovincialis]